MLLCYLWIAENQRQFSLFSIEYLAIVKSNIILAPIPGSQITDFLD